MAKILSKMNNKRDAEEMLPSWFEGEVYELGDEVRNPFTGETVLLDAAELSMYELVKGAELAVVMGVAGTLVSIDECIDIMLQGRDWFLLKNPSAYMKLFD